jgi:hypothetical protein
MTCERILVGSYRRRRIETGEQGEKSMGAGFESRFRVAVARPKLL